MQNRLSLLSVTFVALLASGSMRRNRKLALAVTAIATMALSVTQSTAASATAAPTGAVIATGAVVELDGRAPGFGVRGAAGFEGVVCVCVEGSVEVAVPSVSVGLV